MKSFSQQGIPPKLWIYKYRMSRGGGCLRMSFHTQHQCNKIIINIDLKKSLKLGFGIVFLQTA